MKKFATVFLLLAIPLAIWAQKKPNVKKLDAYFNQALTDWNAPGMAIAIVKDGKVVLSKGYGVESVDTNKPVTDASIFAIASNTKAFTAAALAILVDEGKLAWEDKVIDHLPSFRMEDPYRTMEMTVTDLLTHRSGLGTFAGDVMWYGSDLDRSEVMALTSTLETTYDFRDGYGYSNIMYLTAGELIPAITGQSWDDFIKERFFQPLNMTRSNTSIKDFVGLDGICDPHNELNGKNQSIQWVNWDNISPAGSINSCVKDLSQWMMMQLEGGSLEEKTYFSSDRQEEMWSVENPLAVGPGTRARFKGKSFDGYGGGWFIENYQGAKVVYHSGGYDGFISQTMMIPEENLGIVILTNSINYLPMCLTYKAVDEFLGVKEKTDWSDLYLGYKKGGDKRDEDAKAAMVASRVMDTQPSLELAAYAGTYNDARYGDLEIRQVGDELAFQFVPTSLYRGTLRHWHYDTFQLNWGTQMMLPSGTMRFTLDEAGHVKGVKIKVPNNDLFFEEFNFVKKVD